MACQSELVECQSEPVECQSEPVECQSEPVEDHFVINSSILLSLIAEIYFLANLFSLFHRPYDLPALFYG